MKSAEALAPDAKKLAQSLGRGVKMQPAIPAAVAQQPADIALEIHRGGTTVRAKLPMDDRSAAWLREVLG
jgi:hypothetical protein